MNDAPTPERSRIASALGAVGAGLVWVVGSAIVIISVGSLGVIGLSRSDQGSRYGITLANRALAKSSNLRIEAERTLLVEHGARILNLRLVALDSLGVGQPLVTAREARLGTSWWGLLRGRPGEITIALDHPVISLVRTKEGRWLVPRFKSTTPQEPPSEEPLAFALTMEGGVVRFIRPGETPDTVAHGLALRGTLDRTGKRWNAAIGRGSAALPGPGLAIQRTTGSASFEEGAFTVPRFVVRTDAGWIEMKGEGHIAPKFEAHGGLEVGEWEWRTLARVSGQEALDLDGGVAGKARFTLGDQGLALEAGAFDVLWRDEPLRVSFDGRWRQDHLELSNAGVAWRDARFFGRFDWFNRTSRWALGGRVERLDLSELPRLWPMAELDTTDFAAQIELVRQSGGLEGRVARGSGVYRGIRIDSLAGTWALRQGTQTLDAGARVAGGAARARGTIGRNGLALETTATNITVQALPARVWRELGLSTVPAGHLKSLQARLDGPAGSPRTSGRVALADVRVSGLTLDEAAANFDGRLGGAFALRLSVQGKGGRVGPARADTAWAEARVSADSIVIEEFHAAREDSVLELSARAHRVPGAWEGRVERLSWSSVGLGLTADGPLELRIHDDGGIDVQAARITSTAGTIKAGGSWGGAKRASDLEITVERLDLEALLGTIATDSRVRGVVTGSAHLTGPPGEALWSLDLTGKDVRYRQVEAPEIVARGRFARHSWSADRLSLDTGHGRIAFEGELEWGEPPPWSGSVDAWNQALRKAPSWHGTLTSDSLSLAQLSEWLPQFGGWRGSLEARVELSGRPTSPIANATGSVRSPAWGTASLEDVRYELAYKDERIDVRRLEAGSGDSLQLFARGYLPMRLGWGVANEERLPDLPMELEVRSDRIDLGIVTTFLPTIAAAAGRADLAAKITGTPKRPRTQGRLRVIDGIVRPAGREEVFDRVNAEFTLAGDELTIVSATARQGKNGVIEVKPGGSARIKDLAIDDYALELTARDVTAFASGEYVVRLNGTFKLEDGIRTGGPLPLPHITGNADVIEGVFLYNFADTKRQAASQGPVALPPWTYRVFVEAENNLWYRPPDANVEGTLHDFEVVQQADRFFMLGGVEALRGRFFFLGTSFNVDEGLLFFDNAQQNNPTIDATLTTEKALPQDQGGARETITLTVSGRAFEPNISLSSEPANLSESEIVQLLTFGQFTGGGAALGNLGAQYLMGQLRQDFQGLTEAVGEFEFGETLAEQAGDATSGTGTTTKSYATLGLSRYFTRDLLVRYSQVVGDVTQATQVDYQDLVAEYRLNRLLFLSGQVTRRRGVLITSQDQTIYRFDVHARHEY